MHFKITGFILKHIESLPTGMHVVRVSVTQNTCAHSHTYAPTHTQTHTRTCTHTHTLSSATSVVKSLVVWYRVNTALSGMVVVTLTESLPLGLFFLSVFLFCPFYFFVHLCFFHSGTWSPLLEWERPLWLTLSSSVSCIYAITSSLQLSAHYNWIWQMSYNILYVVCYLHHHQCNAIMAFYMCI